MSIKSFMKECSVVGLSESIFPMWGSEFRKESIVLFVIFDDVNVIVLEAEPTDKWSPELIIAQYCALLNRTLSLLDKSRKLDRSVGL